MDFQITVHRDLPEQELGMRAKVAIVSVRENEDASPL
jgi:hypothetical protein